MNPNRNDEPDQMAATRASGEGSKTMPNLSKMHRNKKEQGGAGGRSLPAGVIHPSLSKLQNILPPLLRCQNTSLELLIETWAVAELVAINSCRLGFYYFVRKQYKS